MNAEERIKQCLETSPKPSAPDELLNKLQKDVTFGQTKARRTALRRWLAPSGGRLSLWRVAATAVIAISVLLPLSYGAARSGYKLIKFIAQGEGVGPGGEQFSYTIEGIAEVEEGVEIEHISFDFATEGQSPLNLTVSKSVVIHVIDANEPLVDEDSQ